MLCESRICCVLTIALFASFLSGVAIAEDLPQVLLEAARHLRNGEPREWSSFPETAEADRLEVTFTGTPNAKPWTLELRQVDVKQAWEVTLNETRLGRLEIDEIDRVILLAVPAGTIRAGENRLRVASKAKSPDDIRLGPVTLHSGPRESRLNEAMLELKVLDAETNERIPARITIVREDGALQTVDGRGSDRLAVRPGTVYTADGEATLGIPAGTYTVYAGRGFEYSLDSTKVTVKSGDAVEATLRIRREVPTTGYVACDTHVHTLTRSGHGDATDRERMITLAAEGIELPIATDHNVHVDHEPLAREMGLRKFFTPVIGNEVTTPVGHFNIFPVERGAAVPDFKSPDWNRLQDGIRRVPGVKAVILNHARDLHSGVRPFGPKLFNAAAAEHLDGRELGVNAMEVVNSSASQTDPTQLLRDWMALLNRGRSITPVGSSDSHDVARHFVGQGRTYIRCDDGDPGAVPVDAAVESFLAGRVRVSYGLLAELTVNGTATSGDVVPVPNDNVRVSVRVLGPHWVSASRVTLYANGIVLREAEITSQVSSESEPGVKWSGEWTLPRPKHDVHLVAIAVGPGIDGPWWRTAKPYQPTSPDWTPHSLACSGAVWLDVDGNGGPTSAHESAEQVIARSNADLPTIAKELREYDEAVAVHVAAILSAKGQDLTGDEARSALQNAEVHVRDGFRRFQEAWRETQMAQSLK